MNKNKILITGGSGFIGTNLVNYFLKKKYNIINLDKISYASTPEKFKTIRNEKNYKFIKLNLANKKPVNNFIQKHKPNIIIHLASESHVDRSIEKSEPFIKSNILGTYYLFNAINDSYSKEQLKKTKIIHVSTDEVYGNNKSKPTKENSAYDPRSPYSAAKASSDHIAKSFLYTFNLPIIILHFCNTYGPYQFPEKFIPTIIFKSLNNEKVPIYGKGKNIREWIFIEDCCRAIEIVMKKGKVGNQFNVGSGYRRNNLFMAKMICSLTEKYKQTRGKRKLLYFVKDRPGHDLRYALNSNLIKKKTGWSIKTNIKNGIQKTLEWYLKNKEWFNHTQKIYKGQRLGKILAKNQNNNTKNKSKVKVSNKFLFPHLKKIKEKYLIY